jgi:hypothetical protein
MSTPQPVIGRSKPGGCEDNDLIEQPDGSRQ